MKTIEQAANEHTSGGWTDDKIVSFKAGVEFAQRWISVEEELPKSASELMLVKWLDSKGDVKYGLATYIDFYSIGLSKKKEFDFIIQGNCKRKVTHWRPITIE